MASTSRSKETSFSRTSPRSALMSMSMSALLAVDAVGAVRVVRVVGGVQLGDHPGG